MCKKAQAVSSKLLGLIATCKVPPRSLVGICLSFLCSVAEVKFGRNVLQEAFRAVFCLLFCTTEPGDVSAQRLAVTIIPIVRPLVFFDIGIDQSTSSTEFLRVVTCSFKAFTSERMAKIAQ